MVFQLTYTTLYEYRFGAPHCSHMRFESKHRIVTSVLADPFHMCCPLWEAWLTILGCPKYVLTVNLHHVVIVDVHQLTLGAQ